MGQREVMQLVCALPGGQKAKLCRLVLNAPPPKWGYAAGKLGTNPGTKDFTTDIPIIRMSGEVTSTTIGA